MDELNSSVESLSAIDRSDRVTAADRSNKDKKKNGFSDALKEKMEEKLKKGKEQKDVFLTHEELDEENINDDEKEDTLDERSQDEDDDTPMDHVDIKA